MDSTGFRISPQPHSELDYLVEGSPLGYKGPNIWENAFYNPSFENTQPWWRVRVSSGMMSSQREIDRDGQFPDYKHKPLEICESKLSEPSSLSPNSNTAAQRGLWNAMALYDRFYVIRCAFVALLLAFTALSSPVANSASSSRWKHLALKTRGSFLVDVSGAPFFWQADTAWELFHRLNHSEVIQYLDDRKAKGYNVIMSVAIAEYKYVLLNTSMY